MPSEWLTTEEWVRDSRGRSWAFELPVLSIVRAISVVAAEGNDAFDLLTCTSEKVGPAYKSIYRLTPWAALEDGTDWNHFLRSRRMTPSLPAPAFVSGLGWPALFATNGLLILQHPDPMRRKGQPIGSNLGIVNRVRNLHTGELRVHGDYDELYARLKRQLGREAKNLSELADVT